jgi:hypothetical protein
MQYHVKLEANYLKVEVAPSETPAEARELLYAVAEAVFKHGRKAILMCAIGCAPLSLMDLYAVARHVVDTPLKHAKIAFLYDTDAEFEASRFMEGLGISRGLDMAVFRTERDAARWFGKSDGAAARIQPG